MKISEDINNIVVEFSNIDGLKGVDKDTGELILSSYPTLGAIAEAKRIKGVTKQVSDTVISWAQSQRKLLASEDQDEDLPEDILEGESLGDPSIPTHKGIPLVGDSPVKTRADVAPSEIYSMAPKFDRNLVFRSDKPL